MKALERLEVLLDEKDERIAELESENSALKNQHRGELNGLLDHDEIPDDESLPIPRLEVVWNPSADRDWRDRTVVYRMIYKHLTGSVVSVPLGCTRVSGGTGDAPKPGELPFRDGHHAHHDSALFGWPLFWMIQGQKPIRLSDADRESLYRTGREHRRG